jgi:hypothetical protein
MENSEPHGLFPGSARPDHATRAGALLPALSMSAAITLSSAHGAALLGRIVSTDTQQKTFVFDAKGQRRNVEAGPRTRLYLQYPGLAADMRADRGIELIGVLDAEARSLAVRMATIYTDSGRELDAVTKLEGGETAVYGKTVLEEGSPHVVAEGLAYALEMGVASQVRVRESIEFGDLKPGMAAYVYASEIAPESIRGVTAVYIKLDARPGAGGAGAFEGEVFRKGSPRRETVHGFEFENLGPPVPPKPPFPMVMTTEAGGRSRMWFLQRAPGHYEIHGVDIGTGEVATIDLSERVGDTSAHIMGFPYSEDGEHDKQLYIWAGRYPGQFFKYELATDTLETVGDGIDDLFYVLGYAVEKSRRMFVGGFPSTRVASVEFGSDIVTDWGVLSTDELQKYIMALTVGGDGILYCSVGLSRPEVYALDLNTGEKRQVLPASMARPEAGAERFASLWTGSDGRVWGALRGTHFLCRQDGIDLIDPETEPGFAEWAEHKFTFQFRGVWPYSGHPFEGGGKRYVKVQNTQEEGARRDQIVLRDVETGSLETVTLVAPVSAGGAVFAVGDVFEGRIYGGMISPAQSFSYDPAEDTFRYYSKYFGGGMVQVYDTLSLADGGILQSSYPDAALDRFDPSAPAMRGRNPRPVARLVEDYGQERIMYLKPGPDGDVFFGTHPTKGRKDGVLGRYRSTDDSVKIWADPLAGQCLTDVAWIPGTDLICIGGTVQTFYGDTGAAAVALWDIRKEESVWRGHPLKDATNYVRILSSPGGRVVGAARDADFNPFYFVLDSTTRKTIAGGPIPFGRLHHPYLCDNPLSSGEVIGAAGSSIFAIDPSTGALREIVRHESIGKLEGMECHDGWFYYGSGQNVWRARLEGGI